MPRVKFSDLDLTDKHAVIWLADQADALTPNVTAAAVHVGEIWEAAAFMKAFPKGTAEHTALADRLRIGDQSAESILDCIERAAPAYWTLAKRATDAELEELLAGLGGYAGAAAR